MSNAGNAQRIAELNDAFRTSFAGGKVVMTEAVNELPSEVKANALLLVSRYTAFDADNDPHGERDFGAFELCGRRFFWKIDYYDKNLRFGSEDPADPQQTTRVLTLMFAEEY
jgi:hypothetical protein